MAKEIEAAGRASADAKAKVDAKAQADAAAKTAAREHAESIRGLREEYAALISSGNLQEAAKKQEEINKALRDTSGAGKDAAKAAQEAADAINAAYKDLGVTTDASLREVADRAKKNFDLLLASGTASARELGQGFADAAQKAIAANDGIAPSWVSAMAATRGYKVQVDEAGKATLEATKNAKAGLDDVATGHRSAGAAAREQVGSVQALADAYTDAGAKALAAQGQFLAAAQAQKNVDTSASSITNSKASASQGVWTQALIVDYLKQSGLDEMLATNLSKQFLNSSGGVDYLASDAQKRWAGKNGTLSEALGKVSEYYQYNDSGKSEAASILAYEKDKAAREEKIRQDAANLRNGTTSPAPAPAPSPGTGSGTGGGSVTYVNNITINGAGDWGSVRGQTRHTDAQSAQTEVDLLRSIAQAKGASSV